MPNLKAIRDRIKSVQNTRKITEAMRLVAAAKVRRAQEQVLTSRPFADRLAQILYRLQSRIQFEKVADLPWLYSDTWEVKCVGILVISSNRGLCGAYNTNVIKRAEERAAQLKAEGMDYTFYLVGQKAVQYFKRRKEPIARTFLDFEQIPTAENAERLLNELQVDFQVGNIQKVEAIYTRFVSLISSRPVLQTIFPIEPDEMMDRSDEVFRMIVRQGKFTVEREEVTPEVSDAPPDMIFEQNPQDILEALLPVYAEAQLLRAMQEGAASELACRMTAMSNASDNAQDLISNLKLGYNKARQASITQELLEVVAGANAAI